MVTLGGCKTDVVRAPLICLAEANERYNEALCNHVSNDYSSQPARTSTGLARKHVLPRALELVARILSTRRNKVTLSENLYAYKILFVLFSFLLAFIAAASDFRLQGTALV